MPSLILLVAVALEGYVVLAVELLAIRQLTPYVGNATDTVAIVIAAVLLPLAFGYEAGGRSGLDAGDEAGVRRRLTRNLLIAALILGLGLSHPSLVAFFEAIGVTHRLVPGRFGSEGWHRGQRDSCSRRRAMEAGNVGQRWGERGRSLGGVQRGPGPSAGGRQALSACGSFDDRAGGDVGRAVGSTGDRALGPQAEPGGFGGTWNFARSRACAFGVERAFPGAGCGRAGTAPRGLGEGRGRSRTCGD